MFSREQKIEICNLVEKDGIAAGGVAATLFPNDKTKMSRMKNDIKRWIVEYQKAQENGTEPFPGKGRRKAEYHVTESEKTKIQKILGFSL